MWPVAKLQNFPSTITVTAHCVVQSWQQIRTTEVQKFSDVLTKRSCGKIVALKAQLSAPLHQGWANYSFVGLVWLASLICAACEQSCTVTDLRKDLRKEKFADACPTLTFCHKTPQLLAP